jgi:hypothetical protein
VNWQKKLLIGVVCVLSITLYFALKPEKKIDFNTDIRPILNKNCITCHGGVKQNGGLSFLFREDAVSSETDSGLQAIIPGDPENSELMKRIVHHDAEIRMPLEKDQLSKVEIELLREWIKQGAEWQDHWAFVKPVKPVPPETNFESHVRNDIDRFILKKLEHLDLKPSPEADKETLLRRVSLDLIGYPLSAEDQNIFLNDTDEDAYEKLVDRLLASPQYGEKWTSLWLDLARYADSKGYEKDMKRSMWPYRDWLIRSLNADMPYNQFITEQLAGDLIPSPTPGQIIATAFHRNTMSNDEGGTNDEEFRTVSIIDRVNTTFDVFQGITMACAQCHSHPYEPIRHEEYYRFMAYFNSTVDADLPSDFPLYSDLYTPENNSNADSILHFVEQLAGEKYFRKTDNTFVKRRKFLLPLLEAEDCDDYNYGVQNNSGINWTEDGVYKDGLTYILFRNIPISDYSSVTIRYRSATGKSILECRLDSVNGPSIGKVILGFTNGKFINLQMPVKFAEGNHAVYFVLSNDLNGHHNQGPADFDWFRLNDKHASTQNKSMLALQEKLQKIPRTKMPIQKELPQTMHRPDFIFVRGNFLNKGEAVKPGIPGIYKTESNNLPANRMDVAEWLTSKDNPLTSRVAVNRIWEQLFGYGLVETLEDFGSQGSRPSHAELLDWLALRFMVDHNWSTKKLIKEIVCSATYRQSSTTSPEALVKDFRNVYLSHFSRTRLSAEQIRDQALAVSGLISKKMYGPSVMPYQPEGIWQVVYSGDEWRTSAGEDRYRRSVYTHWRRTSPYPSSLSFDAMSREVCATRRIRTNTPLQALVLLNDTVYVESAIALAQKVNHSVKMPTDQIQIAYKIALGKMPTEKTLRALLKLYTESLQFYKNNSVRTAAMTSKDAKTPEAAALSAVSNAILNLDDFLTKP